jgi:uncharacterized protein (DUF4415 family)
VVILCQRDSHLPFITISLLFVSAVVGKFYRPIKKPVALRLDADVIAWFKQQGPGYQSRINEVLRREMNSHR